MREAAVAVFEAFFSPFMQKAFAAGVLVSILTGIISVFIVLRKMSFVGAGISHAAFGGVALGFFTGLHPLLTAIVYTVIIALGIERTSRRGRISEDVSIGIFYSVSMALGIALISLSERFNVDLFGYLFGNILAITHEELWLTLLTTLVITGIMLMLLKEFYLITYSEELARVSGINVKAMNALFLVSLSVAIIIAIRIVGIIMVSALLVIPGATARLFAKGLRSMIALSCLTGIISVIAGLLISYAFDIASGASIVLFSAALFFCGLLFRKKADV